MDSRTFIPVCNYPNLNVIPLFLFSTPVLLYFCFEWSAYDGACLSICDSVGVMAGKFSDRFWPLSNCCHIEVIWVEETLMIPTVAQKIFKPITLPIQSVRWMETWKSLIRRQSFTNSGFVSLPTRRVDSVDGEMMVMTSCVLVRWTTYAATMPECTKSTF